MQLEVGLTMRSPAKDFTLKREHLSIKTPDGSTIGLATQKEYAEAGYLRALNQRMRVMRDSINYFPVEANRALQHPVLRQPRRGGPQLAYDQVELSTTRGCVGRLYFHLPGGSKSASTGSTSPSARAMVQLPFRILTKEEAKQFSKSWEDLKQAHDESYKK